MHTSLKLSSDTIVLIDGFVNKDFTNKTNEQIQEIKQEAIEIANSIAEQSNKERESLKEQLTTKADLKDLEIIMKSDLQEIRNEVLQTKYNFVKWLITSQIALVAIFALFAK